MGELLHFADCDGADPCSCDRAGLPLTTGEGNTAASREPDLRFCPGCGHYDWPWNCPTACPAKHLVERWAEQRSGRLREQLDDREHGFAKLVLLAHERGDEFWQNELQIVGDFTLAEARAALGVEGPAG